MNNNDVEMIVNDAAALKWTPLSALKSGEFLACIDGRHTSCVMATPGGDLGLFVALLTAIEEQTGSLNRALVALWLETIVEWHPRFYMHTDAGSVAKLLAKLGVSAQDHGLSNADFVRRPPPGLRNALSGQLLNPEYHGCGFVKSMLLDPAKYGVRKPTVQFAVSAFFDLLWSGSPSVLLEVLEGEHEEEAILHVETRDAETKDNVYIPAIKGLEEGPSKLFLSHKTARRFVVNQNLNLLARSGHLPIDVDIAATETIVDYLCDRQLMTVLEALAPHLPQFDVTYDDMGDELQIAKR